MKNYTRNECKSSPFWQPKMRYVAAHFGPIYQGRECAENLIFPTRFECDFHIFSTRFECDFHIFPTRFECSFNQVLRARAESHFGPKTWRKCLTAFSLELLYPPWNLQSYWNTTNLKKLTVVLEYYEAIETYSLLDNYEALETYSRIGLLRSSGNLQSYWTTTKLRKLTVVLDYYEAMETYSRIWLLRSYGNLQSYWTTTNLTYTLPGNVFAISKSIRNSNGPRTLVILYGPKTHQFSTRFECVSHLPHSFRVCFASSPLVSSVFRIFPTRVEWVSHLPHSFRVYFNQSC
jgi:hypothetical protein